MHIELPRRSWKRLAPENSLSVLASHQSPGYAASAAASSRDSRAKGSVFFSSAVEWIASFGNHLFFSKSDDRPFRLSCTIYNVVQRPRMSSVFPLQLTSYLEPRKSPVHGIASSFLSCAAQFQCSSVDVLHAWYDFSSTPALPDIRACRLSRPFSPSQRDDRA